MTGIWRLSRPRYTVGAVGVVINEAEEILIVEHVFHPKIPWGLPGGWVDRSEALSNTVVREFAEELELEITTEAVIHVEIPPRRGHHIDIAYLCHAKGTVGTLSRELLDYRWVALKDLPPLPNFHQQAVQKAFAYRSRLREV